VYINLRISQVDACKDLSSDKRTRTIKKGCKAIEGGNGELNWFNGGLDSIELLHNELVANSMLY